MVTFDVLVSHLTGSARYYQGMSEIARTARVGPIGDARRWPTRDEAESATALVSGSWEVVYVEQAGDGWLIDGEYRQQ